MKINSKIALSFLLAGVFVLGQGSLFAKSNEKRGKEAGKKVDQAEDAVKAKAKEAQKKAEELAEKTKEKAKELHSDAKEAAHKAVEKA
jgi:F0F1-type ATP synthase membrane subunit b/b'